MALEEALISLLLRKIFLNHVGDLVQLRFLLALALKFNQLK